MAASGGDPEGTRHPLVTVAAVLRGSRAIFVCCGVAAWFSLQSAAVADWRDEVTLTTPGTFPLPRPYRAKYCFGWSKLSAAESTVVTSRPKKNTLMVETEGRTTGVARTLWRMDARQTATANARTLLPVGMEQVETYRSKAVKTRLVFSEDGVTRFRESTGDKGPVKPKEFLFPGMLDLYTASLDVRSQPLKDGDRYNVVVYPATAPYLATLHVLGRERLSVRAGKYEAVKAELSIQRINDKYDLEPQTKFKRGFIWVSDDPDRLVLKIQADIFVGSVWGELEQVTFTGR